MPVAADKSQFDCIRYRSIVRLFDSPVEGERNAALNQALRLCAAHKPPLLFFEAAALSFGSNKAQVDALVDKAARLQVEVDDLAGRLRQREAEAVQLADKVIEANRTIEQLIAQSRKKARQGSHDFRGLLDDLWALPQIRLLLLTLLVSGQAILDWQFEVTLNSVLLFLLNSVVWLIELRLFAKWMSLQFRQDGLLQLLIKLVAFGSGLYVTAYVGSMDGSRTTDLWLALTVLVTFSLLTVSRLSEWLVEDVGRKLWESHLVQILRGCF